MPSKQVTRKNLQGGPPLPLIAKVEILRQQADIPVSVVADVLGITRLAWYLWITGKTARPQLWRQQQVLTLGKAIITGLKTERLPIVRSRLLTLAERKIKVRDTLRHLIAAVT